jgi:hypothetical protein
VVDVVVALADPVINHAEDHVLQRLTLAHVADSLVACAV